MCILHLEYLVIVHPETFYTPLIGTRNQTHIEIL